MRKNKILAMVAAVTLLIPFSACSGTASSSASTKSAATSATTSSAVSTKGSSKSSALSKASAITPDSIKSALKSSIALNVTNVKISGGTVTVIVYDKDALSIDSYVEMNQPNSADTFKYIFGLSKNIQKVIYQSDVPVTDSYGKEKEVMGQTNTMIRKDYEKVSDWNTFRAESPEQYYSIVNFELAPESKISGIHAAWAKYYNQ
jgi:hypothetical protein